MRYNFNLALFFLACGYGSCPAALTNITSVADTTLSEYYPDNNLGGLMFVNAGTTQNFTRNRGLFQFDIAGVLPPHSIVRSASLILEVTHDSGSGYAFADFGLHRMLVSWGEGAGVSPTNSSGAGQGSPALTNEATWLYRFAFDTPWTSPGGDGTNDFVTPPSATQTIYGLDNSPYTFGPNAQVAADVQSWLDAPESNFGWMLLCNDEGSAFTARRFGSREDPANAPILQIDYVVQPQIDRFSMGPGQFSLSFLADGGQNYLVQFADSVSTNWQTLADAGLITETTRVLVIDAAAAPRRFYRVCTY